MILAQNTGPVFPADTVGIRIHQDATWDSTFIASDPDTTGGDSLEFTLDNNPGFALSQFTLSSIHLSWTPGNYDVGSYSSSIIATDSAGVMDTLALDISVQNGNDPPTLGAITDSEIEYTQTYSRTLIINDPDDIHGDSLRISLAGEPAGMTVDSETHILSYDPPDITGDTSYSVTVTVTDDSGATDSQQFTLSVDHRPESAQNLTIDETDGTITVTFNESPATDIDEYILYVGDENDSWTSTNLASSPYENDSPLFGTVQFYTLSTKDINGFTTTYGDTLSLDLSQVSGTWDRDFTIEDDITVPVGETLHINGGTITFANRKGLYVKGTLNINETGSDTTEFTTSGTWWKGIRFIEADTDTSVLRHVKIWDNYLSEIPANTEIDTSYWGGAIFALNSILQINNSTFVNNSKGLEPGGAIALDNSSVTIKQSIFFNNWANFGSAIYCKNSTVNVVNNTVVENNRGSAIKIVGGTPTIQNNIFAYNTEGYAIETTASSSFTHNLFYYTDETQVNPSEFMAVRPSGFGVTDSLHKYTEVPIDSFGNVFASPLFQEYDYESNYSALPDFRLSSNSPAINTGDPASQIGQEPEPNGDIVNLGAFGGTEQATSTALQLPYYFSTDAREDSFYSQILDLPDDEDVAYYLSEADYGNYNENTDWPEWLTLGDTLGQDRIYGTPTNFNVDKSDSLVLIEVRDSNVPPNTEGIRLIINPQNRPPQFYVPLDTIAYEDSLFTLQLVSDDELDSNNPNAENAVTWEGLVETNQGEQNIINNSGLVSWTPTNEEVGTALLQIIAVDNNSGNNTSEKSVQIQVINRNDPPEFSGDQNLAVANTWTEYSDTLDAFDPDSASGDVFTFSIDDGPQGMTVDAQTGAISWFPYYAQYGENSVTFAVQDTAGAADTVSTSISVGDTVLPAPPQNLTGQNADTTIFLNWESSPSGDLKLYRLYQKNPGEDAFSEINSFGLDTLEYTVTSLVNDTTYYFFVSAEDSAGNTNPSDTLAIQPRDTLNPEPPTNFNASDSSGIVYMEWEESPTSDVVEYQVMRSYNGTDFTVIDTVSTPGTQSIWQVDSAAYMWLGVRALDESQNTSILSNIEEIDPPQTPSNFQLIRKAWRLQLTWDAFTSGSPTAILVYRGVTEGTSLQLYEELPPTATSFTDQVNSTDTYYYAVSSYDSIGPSESAPTTTLSGTARTKGDVTGTWIPENGPYKPTGSITVNSGDSLIIQPNTRVKFQGYYDFIVYGTLRVLGTPDSLVRITYDQSVNSTSFYSNWKGITFSNTASGNLIQGAELTRAKSTGSIPGGAIRIDNSSPVIMTCRIDSNQAYTHGGALAVSGNSSPEISGNTFRNNSSSNGMGGAIAILGGNATIRNNLIIENSAADAGAVYIAPSESASFVHNNVVSNGFYAVSTQIYNVGGVWDSQGLSEIAANIFTGNVGSPVGVGVTRENFGTTHNLFYNNYADSIVNGPVGALKDSIENLNFDSTDVYGNMVTDPMFVGDSDSLDQDSPALDAGKPALAYSEEPEPNGDQVNIGRHGNTNRATTSPIRLRTAIPESQQPREDEHFTYIVSGRHDTGAPVTYEAQIDAGAEWLAFSQVNKSLSGDPTNDHVGTQYPVTIYAEDETYNRSATANYILEVVGRAPQITGTVDTSVVQDELLEIRYTSDDDPDVTYAVRQSDFTENVPVFSNDTLRWRPNNNQTGQFAFEIWAKDNHDDSTFVTLDVQVSNVNDPPVFLPGDTLVTAIYEKEVWTYRLDSVGVDADTIWGDSLRFQLLRPPAQISYNDSTTELSWLPTNDDIGTWQFSARATDNAGESDTLVFQVTVINVNDPPEISASFDTTMTEDNTLTFPLSTWQTRVSDPDPTDSLASLTWTFSTRKGLIQGDRISGIPGDSLQFSQLIADTSGVDTLDVQIADNDTTVDTTMVIQVLPLNDPPVFTSQLPDVTTQEDVFRVTLIEKIQPYFHDVDRSDSLRFSAVSLSPGLDSLTLEGDPAAVLSHRWSGMLSNRRSGSLHRSTSLAPPANQGDSTALVAYPTPDFSGILNIVLSATDDSLATISDTLLLTVTGVNDTPQVTIADTSFAEDDTLVLPLAEFIYEPEDTFAEMDTITFNQDIRTSRQFPTPGDIPRKAGISDALHPASNTDIPTLETQVDTNIHHTFSAGFDTLFIWANPNYYSQEPSLWRLMARDSEGATDRQNFYLQVTSAPDPPIFISSIDTVNTQEDVTSLLPVSYLQGLISDADGPTTNPDYIWSVEVQDTTVARVTRVQNLFEIRPAENWNGSVPLYVQVIDTFYTVRDTGTFQVTPLNDAPVVEFPSGFAIDEDDSLIIDLDNYVSDVDNDTSELTWQLPVYFGQDTAGTSRNSLDVQQFKEKPAAPPKAGFGQKITEIVEKKVIGERSKSASPTIYNPAADVINFTLDPDTHTLKILPDPNATVQKAMYRIWVRDPYNAIATDTLLITVDEINDPPAFIVPFPDTTFSEHDTLMYSRQYLENAVRDVDHPGDSLQFDFRVGDNLVLQESDTLYSIRAQQFWFGQDSVFLRVTDGLSTDSLAYRATVINGNDPPVWTDAFPDTTIFRPTQTREFMLRDSSYVYDPDPATPVSSLVFDVEFGRLVRVNFNSGTSTARLFVLQDTTAVDTVYFTATDPAGASNRHMMTVILDPTYVGMEDETLIPQDFTLEQNYPNPFNPVTTIRYGVPEYADVELRIYNLRGQVVLYRSINQQSPGFHQFQWNGTNRLGSKVSSGMYIYHFKAESSTESFQKIRKMLLIR